MPAFIVPLTSRSKDTLALAIIFFKSVSFILLLNIQF